MKRFATFLCLLFLACTVRAQTPVSTTRPAGKLRIVLVGDSTVTDKSGWGPGFKKHLTDDVELINLSLGGRSSKSFINEGHWKDALAKHADYILIQFGHNDCPGKGPDRQTDPDTTYYQYMSQYVDDSRAAGAKPLLVTSLTRRKFDADGRIKSDLWPYVNAVKKLAAEKIVPLVDLHQKSIDLCNVLGPNCNMEIAPTTETGYDSTHLNPIGADLMGALVANELKAAVPQLAAHLK
jgi:pectinesterase